MRWVTSASRGVFDVCLPRPVCPKPRVKPPARCRPYGLRNGTPEMSASLDNAEGFADFGEDIGRLEQFVALVRGAYDGTQASFAFCHGGIGDRWGENARFKELLRKFV